MFRPLKMLMRTPDSEDRTPGVQTYSLSKAIPDKVDHGKLELFEQTFSVLWNAFCSTVGRRGEEKKASCVYWIKTFALYVRNVHNTLCSTDRQTGQTLYWCALSGNIISLDYTSLFLYNIINNEIKISHKLVSINVSMVLYR